MAKNPDPVTGVDYEALGRAIEQTMVRDYINLLGSTPRQMWGSFIRGVTLGFGTVVGGTLVVAVLIWILSYFGGAPVIGDYLLKINHTLQNGKSPVIVAPSSSNQ
jgi:hypothetical protein